MSYGDYHSRNQHDDGALGKGDAQALMQQALEKGMHDMEHTDPDAGTAKLFGLFKMDAGVVNAVNGMYQAISGEMADFLTPRLYNTVLKYGPKLKISGTALSGSALQRTAAGVTLAANLGIFVGAETVTLVNNVIDQHRSSADTARQLAPVLDDLVGKHSVGAYNGVSVGTNSVIWAHRRRASKEASALNSSTVLKAVANNIVNFYGQKDNLRTLRTGKHRDEMFIAEHQADFDRLHERLTEDWKDEAQYGRSYNRRNHRDFDDHHEPGAPRPAEPVMDEKTKLDLKAEATLQLRHKFADQGTRMGKGILNLMLPSVLNRITSSNLARLKKTRQPYSAWEMIHCLSEQLQNNPGGDGNFQLPGQHGKELALEKYVSEIFKQHQREMADLDPNYSELRQSLHDDLEQVAKPIAESLRSGKLNPLMLVRLAGEGKVIKNHGRGLASEVDVKKVLEGYEGKSHKINTVDPKEYLAERNFSLAHLKESLQGLKGEEKLDYAASFPDGALKAAGESEATIKSVQQHRAQLGYKQLLMHEIQGMAAKTDEDLKAGGLGSSQIEQLRKAAQELGERGVEAFEALLSSPTHADGIEHTVNDFVVPKIAGDKAYFGKLIEAGKKAEKQAANDEKIGDEAANDEGEKKPVHKRPVKSHKEREDHRREAEVANDDEFQGVANGRG